MQDFLPMQTDRVHQDAFKLEPCSEAAKADAGQVQRLALMLNPTALQQTANQVNNQ
jgi:hypothetical protein